MSPLLFLFLLVTAGMLYSFPRWRAPLPLLMGATCVGMRQDLEIGPLHFTVMRFLIVIGIARVMSRGERIAGGINLLDKLMFALSACIIGAFIFHKDGALVFRLGVVLDSLGVYMLFRVFVQETQDIIDIFETICIIFAPVALAMVFEKLTGKNLFALLGDSGGEVVFRNGHYRARGPFTHAILAGTIGASGVPMAFYLWRENRKLALIGLGGSLAIVAASGSSGPIMTVMAVVAGLCIWSFRKYLRLICWAGVAMLVALNFIMHDPVYYLVARIDITGGSTGWYRAQLIHSAILFFNEWWLAGTDVTRHWMPTGIYANDTNADITNHLIAMGVSGGVLQLLLFVAVIWAAFAAIGKAMDVEEELEDNHQFLYWTLGAILFGHVVTFFSISYFDQAVPFLYFLLACIGSLKATQAALEEVPDENAPAKDPAAAAPDYGTDLYNHC